MGKNREKNRLNRSKREQAVQSGRIRGVIGPVNTKPGKLHDVSDIDTKDLGQYHSNIIDSMKKDGVLGQFCNVVSSIKFADKSDSFMITRLKERFPTYCGALTMPTFKKILTAYPQVSEAYYTSREAALGELVSLGMERARKTVNSDKPDDFILKLMDRLDDGTICHRNKPENKENVEFSSDTVKTIQKIDEALANVTEPIGPPDGMQPKESDFDDEE